MAAVLLACGTKGKRHSLPHSRILIHQPSMSGLAGQATDIDIYAREILRMRETLNQILADATGQVHLSTEDQRSAVDQAVAAIEQIALSSRSVAETAQAIAIAATRQVEIAAELAGSPSKGEVVVSGG